MPPGHSKAYVRLPDGTLNEVRISGCQPTQAQALLLLTCKPLIYGRLGCIVVLQELITAHCYRARAALMRPVPGAVRAAHFFILLGSQFGGHRYELVKRELRAREGHC